MEINPKALLEYTLQKLSNVTSTKSAEEEYFDYEEEKNKYDIKFKTSYLKTRKWVGFCTFFLVWLWLLATLFIVIANGIGCLPYFTEFQFHLSDTIVVAVVTTSTANVIAFLTIVIKNLYPEQK